ncbi:hypothetical protein [Streptomyces sp. URMC 123]|uniref:hypothetical protein n=1 Tax=Streptomyces sp. URMC 123 TaxID=3423403 RepID=UPI003F1B6AEC
MSPTRHLIKISAVAALVIGLSTGAGAAYAATLDTSAAPATTDARSTTDVRPGGSGDDIWWPSSARPQQDGGSGPDDIWWP